MINNAFSRRCLMSASLVPLLLTALPATQVGAQVMEVVEVTARRRVERDVDVPISMTVMGDEFLRDQNIGSLTDLGTKVPAMQITSSATSPNAPIVAIRGQRPNDLNISADQAVPIYFNEVVLTPSEGSNLAIYDLQDVQVLKGPQGTLFGRNSTGGALLLTPTRPGDEFGGYLEVKVGNYELFGLEGAVDIPVSDVVKMRISGRMLDRDGWQKNTADNALNGKRYWDEDSKGVRLSLAISPSDSLENLFIIAYDENDMVGRAAVLEGFNSSAFVARRMYHAIYNQQDQIFDAIDRLSRGDKHDIESDLYPRDDISVWFASNTTTIDLTEQVTFKSILGYREVDYAQAIDGDGTSQPLLGGMTSETDVVTRNPPLTTVNTEQYSVELQLLGNAFDGAMDWITGAYWFKMNGTRGGALSQVSGPIVDTSQFQNPPPPVDPYYKDHVWANIAAAGLAQYGVHQSDGAGDALNKALGFFAEGTWRFNEQWSWTLGARYSRDDREVTVRNYYGIGRTTDVVLAGLLSGQEFQCATYLTDDPLDGFAPNCERTLSERFEKPSGRTSINFTPVDGALAYVSIASGYRTGGFNMRGGSDDQLGPYNEETVINYELGYKADWSLISELPLRTNFAVYYQDYNDIQQTQTFLSTTSGVGAFSTRIVNAAEAVISGAEVDVTWMATEALTLSLAYAYTDARYKEFEIGIIENNQNGAPPGFGSAVNTVTADNSDADFMFVPKNTLTATITYMLPVAPEWGDMSLMLSVYAQDEQNSLASVAVIDQMAELQVWRPEDVERVKASAEVDGYELINLRYDWRGIMGSRFDLGLYVDNATDEDYVVGGLNVIDILGLNASTYGPPRTFGAAVRYTF